MFDLCAGRNATSPGLLIRSLHGSMRRDGLRCCRRRNVHCQRQLIANYSLPCRTGLRWTERYRTKTAHNTHTYTSAFPPPPITHYCKCACFNRTDINYSNTFAVSYLTAPGNGPVAPPTIHRTTVWICSGTRLSTTWFRVSRINQNKMHIHMHLFRRLFETTQIRTSC